MRYLLVMVACLQFVPLSVMAAESDSSAQETIDPSKMWSAGRKLTAAQAKELEAAVEETPKDIASRIKLLGYHSSPTKRRASTEARAAYAKHVLWLIENVPRTKGLATYMYLYAGVDDDETYIAAKTLWLKQTKIHNEDTQVLDAAAQFFTIRDREMSERFLRQAEALEPKNPHWPKRLGRVYSLSAMPHRGEMTKEKRRAAKKAVKEYERVLELETSQVGKESFYKSLTKMAYLAGDKRKAARYANALLDIAEEGNRNYASALHYGHTILGLLAVDRGASKKAKKHLIKSVQLKGPTRYRNFTPRMLLAKTLFDQGEEKAVLQYLGLCSGFWKRGQKRLETWIRLIKKDETPRFSNLRL